jgi:hypothetical protein
MSSVVLTGIREQRLDINDPKFSDGEAVRWSELGVAVI